MVSGGATAALLPVFFLLPISVAFQDRPTLTAFLGTSTATCYLAVWIVYSKRDDSVGLPDIVYTHFGFLMWAAVATTALCLVLARRRARVTALQNVRRQLVSEAMQADERHNREVAEHLHDGPLQTLLAARLDLDEARERNSDPALETVHAALQETAAALRSTVTQLHPQVLAQLGLTPAIQELLRQFEGRGDYSVDAELEDVGKPESQQLLYRAARELLANIHKHARATTVRVGLSPKGDRIVLTIADDGTGFDPAMVERFVADGHIGLGSLLARFDAMGGSMDVRSEIGYGTQVTVTSPPEPASSRQTPRDDQSLNLVGALEDLGDLGLAHVPLDAVVAGVADAAEHLHGVGGDLHRGVGGDQLGDAGLCRVRQAGVAAAGGVEVGGAGADHRGGHVGQQEAEALMVDDLAAEGRSFLGVGDGLVQRGLRETDRDRGDAQPSGVQGAEGDLQALALRADQPVVVETGIVVERRRWSGPRAGPSSPRACRSSAPADRRGPGSRRCRAPPRRCGRTACRSRPARRG